MINLRRLRDMKERIYKKDFNLEMTKYEEALQQVSSCINHSSLETKLLFEHGFELGYMARESLSLGQIDTSGMPEAGSGVLPRYLRGSDD